MRYITVTLLLFFSALAAEACYCELNPLSPKIINEHSYVALVKIKEQLPFRYKKGDPLNYELVIEEIALLKGTSANKITVYGAPPGAESVRTSCDMPVLSGEEWLIIANNNPDSIPAIGMCGFAIQYRDSNGFRDWQERAAIDRLDFVLQHLRNPLQDYKTDHDRAELYYPSGKPEHIIPYKNGKKHGTALFYYPDGQLYGSVGYKADSLDGKSIWYHRDGSLYRSDKFKHGTQIGSSINYGMRFSPSSIEMYSKKGVLKRSKQYFKNYDGLTPLDTMKLTSETIFKKGKRYKSIYYESNGKVKSIKYFDESDEEDYPLEPGPN